MIDVNDDSHLKASFDRWNALSAEEKLFEAIWAERHNQTYRETLAAAKNRSNPRPRL